jgi:hypothetical protein
LNRNKSAAVAAKSLSPFSEKTEKAPDKAKARPRTWNPDRTTKHEPGKTDYGDDQPPLLTDHPDLIKAWIERWYPEMLEEGLVED